MENILESKIDENLYNNRFESNIDLTPEEQRCFSVVVITMQGILDLFDEELINKLDPVLKDKYIRLYNSLQIVRDDIQFKQVDKRIELKKIRYKELKDLGAKNILKWIL